MPHMIQLLKIMAVVSGGVMFGVISLARVFSLPPSMVPYSSLDAEIPVATSQTTVINSL